MLWPSVVFRATYISDANSAKRKEIKRRKMPRINGFIKSHVVDFSVETSERVKPPDLTPTGEHDHSVSEKSAGLPQLTVRGPQFFIGWSDKPSWVFAPSSKRA